MKRTKKIKTKRTRKSMSKVEFEPQVQLTGNENLIMSTNTDVPRINKPPMKYISGAILLIGLAMVLFVNKPLYLAAIVDGVPIFRWDLNKELTNRFGKQILESMITETLIREEARKNNVVVDPSEISAKQEELLASLGGSVTIDDILKYQGMTKSDFDNQIRMQLIIQKLVGHDIAITDKDVEQYLSTNSGQFIATTPAELTKQARQALFEDQIASRAQQWFAAIKAKANILRYIN